MSDSDDEFISSIYDFSADVSEDENDVEARDENDVEARGWTRVKNPPILISIDGIDQRLLKTAREEVPIVLNNIKRKLFGRRKRDISKVSASEFLKAWIDASFLGHVRSFVNTNICDPVSKSEIIAFVKVELMLSFYKASPAMYFDKDLRAQFPSSAPGMSEKRFGAILKALGGRGNKSVITSGVWRPPMSHNRDVAAAMHIVRQICSSLDFGCYVCWS
jgi:hypothetical protein